MKRIALYVRVSTGSQTTENQERELRAVAEQAKWEIVNVYRDAGISGTKGRDKRPAFDTLCKDAARRKFDMVAAWSVDRLSRSLHDLTGFLKDLHALNVDLYLHQQGLDTSTPTGQGHVPDDRRVRRVRTGRNPRACAGWPRTRQSARQ